MIWISWLERGLLNISLINGVTRFLKDGTLNMRYIRSLDIVNRIGKVAYELALTHDL